VKIDCIVFNGAPMFTKEFKMVMGGVSILQIIFYYLYKSLHNDTLPTEIITDESNFISAAFSLK